MIWVEYALIGYSADLLALDTSAVNLGWRDGDASLDGFVFAGDDRMVSDVWSAGRHVVRDGEHIHPDAIVARYRQTMNSLKDHL